MKFFSLDVFENEVDAVDFDGQLLSIIPTNYQRRYEEEPEMKKPCILTDLLNEDNIFHAEPGDTDGDAKDLILTRIPSLNISCDLWIRKNCIGKYTNIVNKMLCIKTETPFHDVVEYIKAAAGIWIHPDSIFVNMDGTVYNAPASMKITGNCPNKIIFQGDTYRLEGDQYIHRFSVGDIDYADVLSVVYDDDEEEEVIDITHLMGDLTEIPF